MDEIHRSIFKSIDSIVEQRLKEMAVDKTKKGVVHSTSTKTCQVRIDGEIYSCKIPRDVSVYKGDVVFVTYPSGDDKDKFISYIE